MNGLPTNGELAKNFFDKSYLLQKNGHLDRAAHFYKRSIEFQPSAQAHTFLGWVYSLKGLFDQAIEECKSAINLDPEYGNPYNDIGAYLLQQHCYDEARKQRDHFLNVVLNDDCKFANWLGVPEEQVKVKKIK